MQTIRTIVRGEFVHRPIRHSELGILYPSCYSSTGHTIVAIFLSVEKLVSKRIWVPVEGEFISIFRCFAKFDGDK